jgi:hypothetical protein
MKTPLKSLTMALLFLAASAWAIFAGSVPDSGQTRCYNDVEEIPCPSPGQDFYGQDAHYNINPKSYTKLDANGNALADTAAEWATVRDNVTGLIWEVKHDTGLGYADPNEDSNRYTWYDPNPATNGGNPGSPGDGTDTSDFILALNAANYGGFNDWRMPTVKELASLVDLGKNFTRAIDTKYFPNTGSSGYWTSSSYGGGSSHACYVYFYNGFMVGSNKSNSGYVQAVRSGQ